MTADLRIEGGRALIGDALEDAAIDIAQDAVGIISAIGDDRRAAHRLDARGLIVLPGIVDVHGDAFERQMMPRPGVDFPLDVALLETDRQVVANGITTVFHGVTWSWEPGLRGAGNARGILDAMERLRSRFAADTRYHLRHETFNLDAEAEVGEWLTRKRIGILAFNDHMTSTVEASDRAKKLADEMIKRSGLSAQELERLVDRIRRRGNEVPASIARLAEIAAANGVPVFSHDDTSPAQRQWFRSLGSRVSEFPTTIETAQDAAREGDDIVLGAPNVVRGGSHTGWTKAADMVEGGLCSILASDYYYPAQLLAAFRLAADGVAPLARAWRLISEAPAAAAGFGDRGRIAIGCRADVILVDAEHHPRVVATIAAGRVVYLAEADRLLQNG
jgi:alpha-D-ribose 1-methylphosphonate 5-triphosphate diphosphatase